MNEGDKRLRVRNLIRQWKVDIICLQETKLEFISSSVVRSMGCQRVDRCYSASRGAWVACSYRMLYAVALGCPRLWLGWWLTCSLAGGWVVALRVSYCGS